LIFREKKGEGAQRAPGVGVIYISAGTQARQATDRASSMSTIIFERVWVFDNLGSQKSGVGIGASVTGLLKRRGFVWRLKRLTYWGLRLRGLSE
jgi:hypothetical protein